MKILTFLILLTYSHLVYSQTNLQEELNKWKNTTPDNYFIESNDFSLGFVDDSCFYSGQTKELSHHLKLYIKKCTKRLKYNKDTYDISGLLTIDKTNYTIEGEITIQNLEVVYLKDSLLVLLASGKYIFVENNLSRPKLSSGLFRKYFYYDISSNKISSPKGIFGENEGFIGRFSIINDSEYCIGILGKDIFPSNRIKHKFNNIREINYKALGVIFSDLQLEMRSSLLDKLELSNLLYYDNCYYVGLFGSNYHKIHIRFNNVFKNNDGGYTIKGVNLLKDKQCKMEGKITNERIEIIYLSKNKEMFGLVVIGEYVFNEPPPKAATFKGVYRTYFNYNIKSGELFNVDNRDEFTENSGFAGVWFEKKNNIQYNCLWGFIRYPQSLAPGFDNHGGEALMNPKYKKYGWESHFVYDENPYIGSYTSKECDNQWWKE